MASLTTRAQSEIQAVCYFFPPDFTFFRDAIITQKDLVAKIMVHSLF